MIINVNVTDTEVKITDIGTVNQGEYNINTCQFTFSQEYDNLIKRAVFSSGTYDETYVVEITNNSCEIPEGILLLHGNIVLGVYAYDIEDNTLQLRYSPSPTKFFVNRGSYIQDAGHYIPAKPVGDLIEEYNENARQKLIEFNQNVAVSINQFNDNAEDKTNEFNTNAQNKTNDFNTNYNQKVQQFNQSIEGIIDDFDDHVQDKKNEFNQNAENRTTEFNTNAQEKTNILNQIAEGIEDMTTAIQFATFEVDNNMGLYIVQADRLINTNFIFNEENGGLEVMIV